VVKQLCQVVPLCAMGSQQVIPLACATGGEHAVGGNDEPTSTHSTSCVI
jgi:hypothetical protein